MVAVGRMLEAAVAGLLAVTSVVGARADMRDAEPVIDYAAPEGWALHPAALSDRPAVFLVHMTTFDGAGGANADWAQEVGDAQLPAVLAQQTPVFAGCCDVYAPYYRQASLGTLFAPADRRDAGYDHAYRDVRAAFSQFLAATGDRPIILFGHSQGALHVLRLLREEVAETPAGKRLLAAYVIGLGVSDAEPGVADRGIPACARVDQTGCYLGWSTFLRGADVSDYLARNASGFAARGGVGTYRPLCTDLTEFAADKAHGACIDGVARVDPALAVSHPPVGAGNMHYHDINLFASQLRDNLAVRIRAWPTR